MSGRVDGKVVLVTGAGRGNGLGIAIAMAREGASVALADVEPGNLESAKRTVGSFGHPTHSVVADVTDESSVIAMVASATTSLGGLDVLINNAGIYPFRSIDDQTRADFERVLAVNLVGPWLCAKHAYPAIKERGGGAIVNITSCSGHYGGADAWGAAYDASKAGLRQMTSSLAAAFGPHGIRVNAIAPGQVVTEGSGGQEALERGDFEEEAAKTVLGRVGFPDDVGRAAVFLASDDASFITGTSIILDGGAMAIW